MHPVLFRRNDRRARNLTQTVQFRQEPLDPTSFPGLFPSREKPWERGCVGSPLAPKLILCHTLLEQKSFFLCFFSLSPAKLNFFYPSTFICVVYCIVWDMADHGRFMQNLSSCEINQPNFFLPWMWFKPMSSAIPVQCSTNWELFTLWVRNYP